MTVTDCMCWPDEANAMCPLHGMDAPREIEVSGCECGHALALHDAAGCACRINTEGDVCSCVAYVQTSEETT